MPKFSSTALIPIAVACFILMLSNGAYATDITACTEITASNTYYVLTQNVSNCNINAKNVYNSTLDMNGYSINCVSGDALKMTSGMVYGMTVKNGNIIATDSCYGALATYSQGADDLTFRNMNFIAGIEAPSATFMYMSGGSMEIYDSYIKCPYGSSSYCFGYGDVMTNIYVQDSTLEIPQGAGSVFVRPLNLKFVNVNFNDKNESIINDAGSYYALVIVESVNSNIDLIPTVNNENGIVVTKNIHILNVTARDKTTHAGISAKVDVTDVYGTKKSYATDDNGNALIELLEYERYADYSVNTTKYFSNYTIDVKAKDLLSTKSVSVTGLHSTLPELFEIEFPAGENVTITIDERTVVERARDNLLNLIPLAFFALIGVGMIAVAYNKIRGR